MSASKINEATLSAVNIEGVMVRIVAFIGYQAVKP
jgi:hypothetical protein